MGPTAFRHYFMDHRDRIAQPAAPGAPYRWAYPTEGSPGTCLSPAVPRNWWTSSYTCRSPEAAIGSPLAISPPSVLIGSRPPISFCSGGDKFLLIAVGAESVLGHVDYLGTGVSVLQLDHVDVFRTDAGLIEGRPGRFCVGPSTRSSGNDVHINSNAPTRRVRSSAART